MTNAAGFRIISDDGPEEPTPASAAKVFVQAISVPPGLPWDQARIAALEARQAAPLPIGDVAHQLRRIAAWSPGTPGRYAAFYVRKEEIGLRLETLQTVGDRSIKVIFLSGAEQRAQRRRLIYVAAVTAAFGLIVLAGVGMVTGARARLAGRLDAAEQLAGVKLRQATALERLKRQVRALDAARVKGHSLGDFLSDLSWASSAKAPSARIEGLHWQDGFMAVEVRGDDAPFDRQDRTVRKSAKPARAGVWLWGVMPAEDVGPPAAGSAP